VISTHERGRDIVQRRVKLTGLRRPDCLLTQAGYRPPPSWSGSIVTSRHFHIKWHSLTQEPFTSRTRGSSSPGFSRPGPHRASRSSCRPCGTGASSAPTRIGPASPDDSTSPRGGGILTACPSDTPVVREHARTRAPSHLRRPLNAALCFHSAPRFATRVPSTLTMCSSGSDQALPWPGFPIRKPLDHSFFAAPQRVSPLIASFVGRTSTTSARSAAASS
jgi:hypothetical protein